LLSEHFLRKGCERHNKDINGFSPEAMDILIKRDYPGNIRELSQIIENGVLLADTKRILPGNLGEDAPPASLYTHSMCTLKENSETHLAYVFTQTKGDRKETANILGITVRQLQRKLAEMKINSKWSKMIAEL